MVVSFYNLHSKNIKLTKNQEVDMKTTAIFSILVCLILAISVSYNLAQDRNQENQEQNGQQQASEIIQDWPEVAQKAAQSMLDKYGEPDGVTNDRIHWNEAGDWGFTEVRSEEIDHNFPMPHKDVLYQEIDYQVAPEMYSTIVQYDGSVIMERTKGTIAARCDKEGANYLAINLTHEIASGEREIEEARQFYAETMKNMMMQGESSEYLEGFVFDVPE
ncbi:MAG: hypothetical protein WDZ53_07505, partial [Balneolales bacterium]